MFMEGTLKIQIPGEDKYIIPGCYIKLGRFQLTTWVVAYGWYSWGGNRSVCGWYLTNKDNPTEIKPLQKPDLDDCYLIEL